MRGGMIGIEVRTHTMQAGATRDTAVLNLLKSIQEGKGKTNKNNNRHFVDKGGGVGQVFTMI